MVERAVTGIRRRPELLLEPLRTPGCAALAAERAVRGGRRRARPGRGAGPGPAPPAPARRAASARAGWSSRSASGPGPSWCGGRLRAGLAARPAGAGRAGGRSAPVRPVPLDPHGAEAPLPPAAAARAGRRAGLRGQLADGPGRARCAWSTPSTGSASGCRACPATNPGRGPPTRARQPGYPRSMRAAAVWWCWPSSSPGWRWPAWAWPCCGGAWPAPTASARRCAAPAPLRWLWSPAKAARLHRRLRTAVDLIHLAPIRRGPSAARQPLGRRAAPRARVPGRRSSTSTWWWPVRHPRSHRRGLLANLEVQVVEVEQLSVRLSSMSRPEGTPASGWQATPAAARGLRAHLRPARPARRGAGRAQAEIERASGLVDLDELMADTQAPIAVTPPPPPQPLPLPIDVPAARRGPTPLTGPGRTAFDTCDESRSSTRSAPDRRRWRRGPAPGRRPDRRPGRPPPARPRR